LTLVNPKPAGYAFGEKLPSAHVNSVWSQLVYAIDGNAGGSYAPSGGINITTSLDVSTFVCSNGGSFTCNPTALFNGAVQLGNAGADAINIIGTATVSQAATFNNGFIVSAGSVTFDSGFTVGSSTATFNSLVLCNGDVTLGNSALDTLTVNATAVFDGPVTLGTTGDAITVPGTATFAAQATFTSGLVSNNLSALHGDVNLGDSSGDTIALHGVLVNTSQGRQRLRVVETADADTTYGINNGDIFWADASVITAARAYTLSTTGAATGDTITFVNTDAAFAVTVNGVTLQNIGGNVRSVKFVFRAGAWHALHSENQ
jgi:hypothetical protein